MTSLSSIQSAMSIVIFLSKSIFFHIYYIFTRGISSLARPQKNFSIGDSFVIYTVPCKNLLKIPGTPDPVLAERRQRC